MRKIIMIIMAICLALYATVLTTVMICETNKRNEELTKLNEEIKSDDLMIKILYSELDYWYDKALD